MADATHPFVQRKEWLVQQWLGVARDERVRLLHWLVDPTERQFIEIFCAEQNVPGSQLPDVFLRVEAPFEADQSYGRALHAELAAQVRGDAAAGSWRPPTIPSGMRDVDAFLLTIGSLYETHKKSFQRVGAVLAPVHVHDPGAFMGWLQAAMHRVPNKRLKLIVFDDVRRPGLETLARAEPVLVKSVTANLELAAALEELSLAGGLDHPGAQFRHAFVKTANAVSAGNLRAALQVGAHALALVQGLGMPHLGVGIHFVLAGGLISAGRFQEAVQHYYRAEVAAVEAEAAGEPLGPKLRVDARFGVGAVMVGAGSWAQAADWYEQTVPCAEHAKDPGKQLECWRMACYAHERAGQFDRAWKAGVAGLGVGHAMTPEQRKASTLAYLGEGMLRLTQVGSYRDHAYAVHDQMQKLLGPDWRPPSDDKRRGA